jgi:hypothetical protein
MTYVVAGFGKFGRLALERLTRACPTSSVLVLDENADRKPCDLPVTATFFRADAVSFLLDSPLLQDDDVVIPMVPVHLAADYLLAAMPGLRKVPFPSELSHRVPNPYAPDAESLCCSYADFLCPDDCPAGTCCTVTGEQRDPLFSLLESLTMPGFTMMVLRSLQILPGVGGYPLRDLLNLGKSLARGTGIVATACRCHAVMTALAR